MNGPRTIDIDAAKLARLRKGYDDAIAAGKTHRDVVLVDGDEFVVGYLMYLIVYAEWRLEGKAP